MGMFSTLGLLMEVPLESALVQLPVADEVKQALLTGEGKCGQLYHLVLSYEAANWLIIPAQAKELGIPENVIAQKYFECVEYVNNIWRELMVPYDTAAASED